MTPPREALRDRGAVHCYQAARAVRRPPMDLLSYQLLSGAGLATDEDGQIGRRKPLDEGVDLLHGITGSDKRAKPDPP